jgi:hypothetical protein
MPGKEMIRLSASIAGQMPRRWPGLRTGMTRAGSGGNWNVTRKRYRDCPLPVQTGLPC